MIISNASTKSITNAINLSNNIYIPKDIINKCARIYASLDKGSNKILHNNY